MIEQDPEDRKVPMESLAIMFAAGAVIGLIALLLALMVELL